MNTRAHLIDDVLDLMRTSPRWTVESALHRVILFDGDYYAYWMRLSGDARRALIQTIERHKQKVRMRN